MKRILVVANKTASEEALLDYIEARAGEGEVEFILLVPSSPPADHGFTYTEGEAWADAEVRMRHAVSALNQRGVMVMGIVGDSRPMDAIHDVMSGGGFDEVIISTLPRKLSRWLHMDLPRRVAERYGVRVISLTPSAPPHVIKPQAA